MREVLPPPRGQVVDHGDFTVRYGEVDDGGLPGGLSVGSAVKAGQQIVISGKVNEYLGRLVFSSPEWELLDKELLHTARIVPVYPLTKGVSTKWLRRLVKQSVDY